MPCLTKGQPSTVSQDQHQTLLIDLPVQIISMATVLSSLNTSRTGIPFSKGTSMTNVKMPGSGDDAEEIPLYDMPDEGPMKNTLKATAEAVQTSTLPKDEVVSVDKPCMQRLIRLRK